MANSTASLNSDRSPPSVRAASTPGAAEPQHLRFRWPAPRTVLWLHIAVVCYTGIFVPLSICGIMWVSGFHASDYGQTSFRGDLLVTSAALLFVSIFLFPLIMLLSLCLAPASRRLWLCGLVEVLLVFAQILSIGSLVGCTRLC